MDRDRRLMEDREELLLDELVVELDDNERCRRLRLKILYIFIFSSIYE